MSGSNGSHAAIISLARRHGLEILEPLAINELGLDFQIVIAPDRNNLKWVLRIPRRPDVLPKIDYEVKVLNFLKQRIPAEVPNWKIVSPELVAYSLLTDSTAISIDAATYAVTWHIDKEGKTYTKTLAKILVAMHGLSRSDAIAAGYRHSSVGEVRQTLMKDIDQVKAELGLSADNEKRWRSWAEDDSCWPDFTVPIHGDLYAGHVLVNGKEEATGIIDWTEAEISDPSIDFSGQFAAFGETGLRLLLAEYEAAGGRVWPNMLRHTLERSAAYPIKYGLYAITSKDQKHIAAAKEQLGV